AATATAHAERASVRRIRPRRVNVALRNTPHRGPMPPNERIAGAYFAPWQDAALASLKAPPAALTHAYPAWLQIDAAGRTLRSVDWKPRTTPTTAPLMRIAHSHGLRVIPTLSNATNARFDSHRIQMMLRTPGAAQGMIQQLVHFVDGNDLDGLQLDIEFLS